MRFHRVNRVYEIKDTGEKSELYFELCEKLPHVTLNPGFICPKDTKSGSWYNDPFIEIVTVNPDIVAPPIAVKRARSSLGTLIEAICAAIAAAWDPAKTKVVFHSSGLDSRVISSCIRKLNQERGDEWLGNILFLSNRWESKPFTKIMKAQGWKPSQYAAYTDGGPDMHFDRVLDFERYWYTNNAPVPMLGRFFGYLPEWAQEKGLLPGNDQLIFFNGHGPEFGGNNREGMWKTSGGSAHVTSRIQHFKRHDYYSPSMLNYPSNSHGIFVLAEANVVNRALGHSSKGSIRQAIERALSPETLRIPRRPGNDHRGKPVARSVMLRSEACFNESIYAKLTGKRWKTPSNAAISKAWAEWGVASLCEHLVGSGVDVRL